MSEVFADRLMDAIDQKGSPICVGIDPIFESIPDPIRAKFSEGGDESEEAVDTIFEFTTAVLRIVAPLVPIVKFQSAYFEKYLWEGVEAYYSLVAEAKELGLLVIGDVKRGDMSTSAAAYAAGHLDEQRTGDADEIAVPDAITINPMQGLDAIAPFIDVAKHQGKGLFALVRTSNPGSADFQDVKLEDGRTWSEMVADKLAAVAATPELMGRRGYSSFGAVVGANQTHTMQSLRQRMPQSIFLLPGYGAQGATAEMTRAAFTNGRGAIVSASRSILYAHKEPKYASQFGQNWEQCVEAAVKDMKADVNRVIGA